MQKVFKRSLAVVLSLMMVATMLIGGFTASAWDLVDVQYSACEDYSTLISQDWSLAEGLEGNSSKQCTLGGDLMCHIYNDTRTNPALDITYATHVVFDLWVSDAAAFKAGIQSAADCGFNLDDADHESQWGGSGGTINRDATFRPAFNNLQDGWNHIILPLDAESECWNLASARFYAVGGTGFAGITIRLDDIRFVEEAALTDSYAKRTAAKDATIAISALPAYNDITLANEAAVIAAAEAYAAVDADYIDMVKGAADLDAAITKIEGLKDAAGDAANQEAANVVIDQIAALNVQSYADKAAVEAARAAYEALTPGQKILVTNVSALEAAEATIKALTPVDVQFRSMDTFKDVNWTGTDCSPSNEYLEGGAAIKATVTADWFFLHTYALDRVAVNTAGATHVAFDLWVEDGAAFSAAVQSALDCGINMDSEDKREQWGTSGGVVGWENFKPALANLKDGWNHVVAPMNAESTCTNLYDIRIYFAGANVVGQTIIVDDIRFVNQVVLNGAQADRNVAKDATIAIKAIPAIDALTVEDEAIVTAAADAYAAVKDEYKGMVQNAAAIAAAQAKIEELKTPAKLAIVGPDEKGKFYYEDGTQVTGYQIVEVDGVYYYVADFYKAVTNKVLYIGGKLAADAGIADGYYAFDENGVMTAANGIVDGRYFENGVRAKLYEIIEVDGAYYFVSDYYKLAKDCKLFLSKAIVAGTDFACGFYTFDADGKMILD